MMIELLRKINETENLNFLIGIPAFGGMIQTGFTQSLLSLHRLFIENDIRFEFAFISGESLIPRARNSIMAKFLANQTFTHLFFIDTDISFRVESVVNLILSGFELTGVSYPKKQINWERVKHLVKQDVDDKTLMNQMSDMNYNLIFHKNNKGTYLNMLGSFVESKDIPTGFMMIKRIVADLLVLNYPEKKYNNNVAGYNDGDYFYDFFACGVVDGIYLSEDYFFCKLCRDIGIELFLDTQSTLVHTGKQDFVGCLKHFLDDDKFNQDLQMINKKR